MTCVGQQALTCDILDGMVLDLFAEWQHKEWFWRNEQEHTHEHLLRRSIIRTCQLKRASHRDQTILSWSPASEIRTLCLGALVLGNPDERVRQQDGQGLYKALAQHWTPGALNGMFTWTNTERGEDCWRRCSEEAYAAQSVLRLEPFVLVEHLSSVLQQKLTILRSLGVKPTHELLSTHSASIGFPEKFDLDMLL